ncbi:hypothetical protein AURDEDRAFT_127071 [Auricularia subglabra TFB-10046 SS5]|nr:hypothetical protein AURDEDRAFT_127071 [Auricularia subglabra TFB-10046 SS5]
MLLPTWASSLSGGQPERSTGLCLNSSSSLTAAHTGEHLVERLAKCLNLYHITPLTLCADNATNNDSLKPKKVKKSVKIRAGNKRTSTYVEEEEAQDVGGEVLEDPDGIYLDPNNPEVDAAKEAHDAASIGKATAAAYDEAILRGIYVSDKEKQTALGLFPKARCYRPSRRATLGDIDHHYTQVAGLARRVHDASVLAKRFEELIVKDKELCKRINKRALDRRVPTRNADLDCLDAHLLLQSPVKQLTNEPSYDLSKYRLTQPQWTLSAQLQAVLEMFKGPTKVFSATAVPLVHEVVPLIEKLEGKLVLVRDDEKQPPIMRVAAIVALEVVGKYYALSDDTEVYRISMIMCPQRKLHWFHKNKWRPDDIVEARRVAIACWNASYKGDAPELSPSAPSTAAAKKKRAAQSVYALEDSDDDEPCARGQQDTIEAYLDSPTVDYNAVKSYGGLMQYWEAQRKVTPRVAQMALDFLSAPATSVDVERTFSNGRLKVSHLQHNKSTETFQAQMALRSWDGQPFWPGIDHCAEAIAANSKSAKKAKSSQADIRANLRIPALSSHVRMVDGTLEARFICGSICGCNTCYPNSSLARPGAYLQVTPVYEFAALLVAAGLASGLASHVWSTRVLLPRAVRALGDKAPTLRSASAAQGVLETHAIAPSLGFSGAIYALVTLVAFGSPSAKVSIIFLAIIFLVFFSFPIAWCFRAFDHAAHLDGAAFGAAFGAA